MIFKLFVTSKALPHRKQQAGNCCPVCRLFNSRRCGTQTFTTSFWYRHSSITLGLIVFLIYIFFSFYSSFVLMFMACEMLVIAAMQLQFHKHHYVLRYLRPGLPESCDFVMLDVGVLLLGAVADFSDCMVHLLISSHSPPPPPL